MESKNLSVYGYDHVHKVVLQDGLVVVALVDTKGDQLTLKLSRHAAERFAELLQALPNETPDEN